MLEMKQQFPGCLGLQYRYSDFGRMIWVDASKASVNVWMCCWVTSDEPYVAVTHVFIRVVIMLSHTHL